MLTGQKFVLFCLPRPKYGLADGLKGVDGVPERFGCKLATFTAVNLKANVSNAKVSCCAVAIAAYEQSASCHPVT